MPAEQCAACHGWVVKSIQCPVCKKQFCFYCITIEGICPGCFREGYRKRAAGIVKVDQGVR